MNNAYHFQAVWICIMIWLAVVSHTEDVVFCAAIVTVCHIAGVIIDRLDTIIKRIDKS